MGNQLHFNLKKKIKNNLLFFSILGGILEQKEDMEEKYKKPEQSIDLC